MSDVVDFLAFRAARRRETKPASALANCLMHDTLEDLTELTEVLSEASSADELHLTEYDRNQLDYLAMLADDFLDIYEQLGLNLVEEELTNEER